eukprot:2907478-Lingulodinium_polyedra.AAC.1
MGVTRIINGTTDPMYIVTNANTSADHSKTKWKYRQRPGQWQCKYAYLSTRLEDSKIRMDHTHEQR